MGRVRRRALEQDVLTYILPMHGQHDIYQIVVQFSPAHMIPTCVNDVASFSENGTSSTLASVRANKVFPKCASIEAI